MTTLPNIPLPRSALLGVLTTIQNGPTFARQDIMSFAGMCSTDELAAHVKASFQRLGTAEKVFALEALQSRVAPAPAYHPAMVPQLVQQQQAQAKPRETAAEWAARMDHKKPRRAPRPVAEDSPAMKVGLAIAAEAGRAHAERRIAAAAEHNITASLALAGRYRSAL